jgi:predicted Rossmann fold nucleotide-binding protein DprA/Smf involved in DNA uptake
VLIAENIGVVSGYGKGLDRVAFETILEHQEGRAIAVLLSPFPPETPFKDSLAEARNLLVDSLALALLVPDVDQDTQNRAEAALQRGMPVLVGMTDSPENRALISQGAFLMTDPGEVVDMVQQAIIDDAMQAQIAQTPAAETAPQPQQLLNSDEDFALHGDDLDPIDPDEALDILTSMGSVPSSLRNRLMAMEKLNQPDDSE